MNNQTQGTNTEKLGQNSSLDDRGPCEREGDRTCIGDITYVCKNGRWKSIGKFCQDDN